jgi:hypothetical protein
MVVDQEQNAKLSSRTSDLRNALAIPDRVQLADRGRDVGMLRMR